jgi:hypothetical protein
MRRAACAVCAMSTVVWCFLANFHWLTPVPWQASTFVALLSFVVGSMAATGRWPWHIEDTRPGPPCRRTGRRA